MQTSGDGEKGGGEGRVGGGEDEEEQQGKSLSLPNLTRSLMYSRGKS